MGIALKTIVNHLKGSKKEGRKEKHGGDEPI
jgi:hypothetical protein